MMGLYRRVSSWVVAAGGCALLLSGCRSSKVEDAVAASATLVVVPPLVSSYAVAYESNTAAQSSSIAVGAPTEWYSQKVTKSELWQKSLLHGHKFHEPWKYMGTREGEHYLALYPFLGFREIYRIDASEYEIEEPFELTARSYQWREIAEFSHLGAVQVLQIEPLVLEVPDALFQPGFGEGGVSVEHLFMQDVEILEFE